MRKRSQYRPKGVRLDNINYVLTGMRPLSSQTSALTLKLKNHAALDELAHGRGNQSHADIVIAALNMTEALAIIEIGNDYSDDIRAGQDALLAMAVRGVNTGKWLFTGPELTAVNLAMEIHDAQLDACTIAQVEKAMDIVTRTLRAKKARPITKETA